MADQLTIDQLISAIKYHRLSFHKVGLTKAGEVLARMIGRDQPYSYVYVHGVINGNLTPGQPFIEAVEKWYADAIKGIDPEAVGIHDVTIRSFNPKVEGALWNGGLRFCNQCGNPFLPNNHQRLYCYICRPVG